MRRALVLISVCAAALAICSLSFAAVGTISSVNADGALATNWNLFCIPNIPLDPTPPAVLHIWDPAGDGSGLDGARYLFRYDAATQSMPQYDHWDPGPFGNMLVGDGYWVKLAPGEQTLIQYQGMTDNDTTDMWISLPKAGWSMIGHPYSYPEDEAAAVANPFPWASVEVTDGTVTKTMLEARNAGWLQSIVYWYDAPTQSMKTVGLPEDFQPCETLLAWHGYWVLTYVDNLALILTANPPP